MINPDESYNRLHDHMMAIARERDWLQIQVDKWRKIADDLAYLHRRCEGLDGAWDEELITYNQAVKETKQGDKQ